MAIVGSGGGRECAWPSSTASARSTSVDLDPVAVHEMMQTATKPSGDVYDGPQIASPSTWGAATCAARASPLPQHRAGALRRPTAAAGVLAITPNDLYTVEAFVDFFSTLAPDGTLVVSRWDTEIDRLVALAAEALERIGVESPAKHLYACTGGHVTTLLAAKTPLDPREVVLPQVLRQAQQAHRGLRPRPASRRAAPPARPGPRRRARHPGRPARATGDLPLFAFLVHRQARSARRPRRAPRPRPTPRASSSSRAMSPSSSSSSSSASACRSAYRRAPHGRPARPLLFFTAWAPPPRSFAVLLPRALHPARPPRSTPTPPSSPFVPGLHGGRRRAARGEEGLARADRAGAAAGPRAEILVAVLARRPSGSAPSSTPSSSSPSACASSPPSPPIVPVGVLAGSLLALGIKLVAARSPALLPWCWGMGA